MVGCLESLNPPGPRLSAQFGSSKDLVERAESLVEFQTKSVLLVWRRQRVGFQDEDRYRLLDDVP